MKLDDMMRAVAGTSSPAAGGPTTPVADVLAWQREMERAQTEAWFHGFAGSRSETSQAETKSSTEGKGPGEERRTARPSASGSDSSAAVHMRRASATSVDCNVRPFVVAGQVLPAAYQSASIPVDAVPTVNTASVSQAPPGDRPMDTSHMVYATASRAMQAEDHGPRIALTIVESPPAADVDDTGPAGRNVRQESTRLPVRVHVEGDRHDATVWLGLDTQAAVHLPTVTRAIAQWLAQAGYGQSRWICNGHPLDLDSLPGVVAENDRRASRATEPFPIIDQHLGESA